VGKADLFCGDWSQQADCKNGFSRQKPDGLTIIRPNEIETFLQDRPAGKLCGIGKVTDAKLEETGIGTIGDLAGYNVVELVSAFGNNHGAWLKKSTQGVDESPVNLISRCMAGTGR